MFGFCIVYRPAKFFGVRHVSQPIAAVDRRRQSLHRRVRECVRACYLSPVADTRARVRLRARERDFCVSACIQSVQYENNAYALLARALLDAYARVHSVSASTKNVYNYEVVIVEVL